MATLESQYKSYMIENPDCGYTFDDWMEKVLKPIINSANDRIEKINNNERNNTKTRNRFRG